MQPTAAKVFINSLYTTLARGRIRSNAALQYVSPPLFLYYICTKYPNMRFTGGMPVLSWPGHWREMLALPPGSLSGYCNDLLLSIRHANLSECADPRLLFAPKDTPDSLPGKALHGIIHSIEKMSRTMQAPFSAQGWGGVYAALLRDFWQWEKNAWRGSTVLASFMLALTAPEEGDSVTDPVCMTGNLLAAALGSGDAAQPTPPAKLTLHGFDRNIEMLRMAQLHLWLCGAEGTHFNAEDTLDEYPLRNEKFDVLLCAPPSGVRMDKALLPLDLQGLPNRSDVLYTEVITKLFSKKACVLVPYTFVTGSSPRLAAYRKFLLERGMLTACIALPAIVGKKSFLLLLDKAHRSDTIILADLNKLLPTEERDLAQWHPDLNKLIAWIHGNDTLPVDRKGPCFPISPQEAEKRDFSFDLSAYAELDFSPLQSEPIQQILDDLLRLELGDEYAALASSGGGVVGELMRLKELFPPEV